MCLRCCQETVKSLTQGAPVSAGGPQPQAGLAHAPPQPAGARRLSTHALALALALVAGEAVPGATATPSPGSEAISVPRGDGVRLPGTSPQGRRLALVRKGQSRSQGPWESCAPCERACSGPGALALDVPGGTERPFSPSTDETVLAAAPGPGTWRRGAPAPPPPTRKAGRVFLSETPLLIKMKISKVTADIYLARGGDREA